MTTPAVPGRTQVGANYPWYGNKMGLWFGPTQDDIPPALRPVVVTGDAAMRKDWNDSFPALLTRLKDHHVDFLRIWLLGNAFNYGTNTTPWQPPPTSATAWTNAYAEHLRTLLDHCKQKAMKVILVLISHPAFFQGVREALANDTSVRTEFFQRVLDPMLVVSNGFRSTVVAWETVNEPNWATDYWLSKILTGQPLRAAGLPSPIRLWPGTPGVPEANMRAFLGQAAMRIQGQGHKVTHGYSHGLACQYQIPPYTGISLPANVSVADEPIFGVHAPLSVYFRQFHYYPVEVNLPLLGRLDFRNDLPSYAASGSAFLGEISSSRPNPSRSRAEPEFASWGRLGGRDLPGEFDATFFRLILARQLDYQQVYLWPNREHWKGSAEPLLSNDALDAVDRFRTSPTLPTV